MDRSVSSTTRTREFPCLSQRAYAQQTVRSPQRLERDFNSTVLGYGLPYAYDLTCGNPAGASPIANTRSGNIRIDACESGTIFLERLYR